MAESVTRLGESEALLTTDKSPLTLPAVEGSKVTLKLVFCPAAKVRGSDGPFTLTPAPVAVACEMVTLPVPVSLATTGKVLLLPIVMFPKLREVGATLSKDVVGVVVVAGVVVVVGVVVVDVETVEVSEANMTSTQ